MCKYFILLSFLLYLFDWPAHFDAPVPLFHCLLMRNPFDLCATQEINTNECSIHSISRCPAAQLPNCQIAQLAECPVVLFMTAQQKSKRSTWRMSNAALANSKRKRRSSTRVFVKSDCSTIQVAHFPPVCPYVCLPVHVRVTLCIQSANSAQKV